MPWLTDMFPGLGKQQLAGKSKMLRKQGWLVEKRWNEERRRTQCWTEEPVQNGIEPSQDQPMQGPIDGQKFESALVRMIEELYQLRTDKKEMARTNAELLKENTQLKKDNESLTQDNLKLRSYGLTTVGVTPAMQRVMREFGGG